MLDRLPRRRSLRRHRRKKRQMSACIEQELETRAYERLAAELRREQERLLTQLRTLAAALHAAQGPA